MFWIIVGILAIIFSALQDLFEILPFLLLGFVIFIAFVWIVDAIQKPIRAKKLREQRQREEAERREKAVKEEIERRAKAEREKALRLAEIAKEAAKQREKQAHEQAEKIVSEYSLECYKMPQQHHKITPQGKLSMNTTIAKQVREVSNCFIGYQEELSQIDAQIEKLYKKASGILVWSNFSSEEERLKFLQCKLLELKELKKQAHCLYDERQSKNIHLTYFDPVALTNLRKAILALQNSKKCISISGSSTKDFFITKEPKEHSYFHSSTAPVVLNFGDVKAYCYPKIILLFEGDYFIGATNPDGLTIAVSQKEETARYYFDKNDYKDNRFLGSDSFVVRKGFERTTWLHTCKDGSPDLRYSYNPSTHFRDDVVRYGIVRFFIGKYCAEFAFSSHQAYEALSLAQRTYCTNNSVITDPIPTLLELFQNLGTENDLIKEMQDQQMLHGEKTLPVCRIIESRNI